MKYAPKNYLFCLLLTFILIACSEEKPEILGLTEEEAAEEVSSILTGDVNAITGDVRLLSNTAIFKSNAGRTECGVLFDTLINYNYDGANIQYDLEFTYHYGLNCTNNIPEELTFDFQSSSTYEGPRLIRTGNATGQATAGGLRLNASEYDLNGSLTSNSVVTQKERNQKTFTGQSEVTLSELLISKTTQQVLSGTAAISSSGSSSDGESYEFRASVSYQGNGEAMVTINGQQYVINLTTGEVTAQ